MRHIKDTSSICSICFYVQRGSFHGSRKEELAQSIKEHQTVAETLLGQSGELTFHLLTICSFSPAILHYFWIHCQVFGDRVRSFLLVWFYPSILETVLACHWIYGDATPTNLCNVAWLGLIGNLRFNARRKACIEDKLLRPGKKPRHPRYSLAELIKKSEENYVDFCEARCSVFRWGIVNLLKTTWLNLW